tara:strand:- start:1092 stop:1964 length:873 start_codon:yes stop_codon:yes gene_type:complete
MATLGTYYFDTASFANATTIYDDANLTTVASNGFYSDNSIVREQVSGVLFAGQSCAVPTPTPTPTPSPTPTPAPTPTPTPAPTPGPTPSPTPSPTPGPTPSPTPGPTPSPVPNQYQIQNCSSGVQENVSLPQAVNVGESIQWQSVCWEVMGAPTGTAQAISPQNYYNDCAACQATPSPTPTTWNCSNGTCVEITDGTGTYSTLSACQAACATTPTPTPAPGYVVFGQYSSSTLCSGSYSNIYLDNSSFSSATVAYADATFTTLHASGYFTVGNSYRYWTGSSFTLSGNCV